MPRNIWNLDETGVQNISKAEAVVAWFVRASLMKKISSLEMEVNSEKQLRSVYLFSALSLSLCFLSLPLCGWLKWMFCR